eukprot:SAG22_NODE_7485_length_735_cov_1.235849_1_plen_207_part_01
MAHLEALLVADVVRLIADAVAAADALCLALTARAFRDALFARFPPAAGGRFATSVDGGLVCSVSRMRWARALGPAFCPGWLLYKDVPGTCRRIARAGRLGALEWARADGYEWSSATCTAAAGGGHLAVLRFARGQGCEWGKVTFAAAAQGGHLAVCEWLLAGGCPWNQAAANAAAGSGHLPLLRWLVVEQGCRCSWATMTAAAQMPA